MGTKSSMRRALHHAMPNATADEAFDFGWKHGQGRYASKRMQEIEAESRRMQSQRDKARKRVAALQARLAELEKCLADCTGNDLATDTRRHDLLTVRGESGGDDE